MFPFTQEPSSQSHSQCLAKIPDDGFWVNRNMLERLL